MKDYKRLVLWTDYFNSTLSREQGRRIPRDKSVKDPTLDELTEAAQRLNYEPEPVIAKHPLRMMINSGYISIEKKNTAKKSVVISEVARVLSIVKGERAAAAAKEQVKGHPKKH